MFSSNQIVNLYKSPHAVSQRTTGSENVPSHGSLSKAGKVRSITPKLEARERHSSAPRVDNRSAYRKRFVLGRESGQYSPGQRRRKKRR